jgi:hypothetical protein
MIFFQTFTPANQNTTHVTTIEFKIIIKYDLKTESFCRDDFPTFSEVVCFAKIFSATESKNTLPAEEMREFSSRDGLQKCCVASSVTFLYVGSTLIPGKRDGSVRHKIFADLGREPDVFDSYRISSGG